MVHLGGKSRKYDISMHENDIFMLENNISVHDNEHFAPGMIFFASKIKCSWKIGLYTILA